MLASFGSRGPFGTTGTLRIGSDGEGEFQRFEVFKQGPISKERFAVTPAQLEALATAVRRSGFFELRSARETGVQDGTYCLLKITVDGRSHEVETVNIAVPEFDRLCRQINEIVPPTCRIFYNQLPR